jgi:hypothetical protein
MAIHTDVGRGNFIVSAFPVLLLEIVGESIEYSFEIPEIRTHHMNIETNPSYWCHEGAKGRSQVRVRGRRKVLDPVQCGGDPAWQPLPRTFYAQPEVSWKGSSLPR